MGKTSTKMRRGGQWGCNPARPCPPDKKCVQTREGSICQSLYEYGGRRKTRRRRGGQPCNNSRPCRQGSCYMTSPGAGICQGGARRKTRRRR